MRRREILTTIGASTAWPLAAHSQQPDRPRKIGVLMGLADGDPEGQARIAAFRRGLEDLGWTDGRNIQIEIRWAAGSIDRTHAYAADLVRQAPAVILVNTPPGLAALQRATQTIPIVFVQVLDASESGVVANPARPGANITGFTSFYEFAMTGKWLGLLKEIAPHIKRIAAMQNPNHPSWSGYWRAIEAIAPSLGVRAQPAAVSEADQIDRAIDEIAREANSGLLVLPDTFNVVHRDRILSRAAHHRLPAIYPSRFFVTGGGLISYGADLVDQLRRSATYVDRILRGERPGDLPVQASTKFELVINLKTAKSLGLVVPVSLLVQTDDVIE